MAPQAKMIFTFLMVEKLKEEYSFMNILCIMLLSYIWYEIQISMPKNKISLEQNIFILPIGTSALQWQSLEVVVD
jgi:hypothetical protein